jgi:Ca2+-binding EF-hand superfamily protein
MKKLITITIVTALAGVAVASAQPDAGVEKGQCGGGRGFGMHKFEHMDANSDGRVTRDEMLKRATEHFDKADANKDGSVTAEEREAAFKKHAEERFTQQDKNKDGALSGDELPPRFAKHTEKLDTNKDGKLTKAELQVFAAEHKGRFGRHAGAKGPHTRAELVAHVEKRFEKLDQNRDGALSQDELATVRHGRHGHHGHEGGRGRGEQHDEG